MPWTETYNLLRTIFDYGIPALIWIGIFIWIGTMIWRYR